VAEGAINNHVKTPHLTLKILVAMVLGLLIGLGIRHLPLSFQVESILVDGILKTGGTIFITILKMLVVPVVFVSLVCGSSSLEVRKLGRVGFKTLLLYLFTTAVAIALALAIASALGIGKDLHLETAGAFTAKAAPSFKQIIIGLVPSNPFKALVQGEMLQIIMFSLLLGVAISLSGKAGERIAAIFRDLNSVIIHFIIMVMRITPYGVFCLIAALVAKQGFGLIDDLLGYFIVVLLVLGVHAAVTYTSLLRFVGRLNPLIFFRKMYTAMLFAFSVSSSNASIPVVMETVRDKLGVNNAIASFVIPLGATVNMDGTAIMQGVATVFIANAYHIHLGLSGYLIVILMATLSSIGTAGVPSVGLITLAMVLRQVGLPVEGIGLIIGVDRLLDMTRTAVNIAGDSTVACIVGKSEAGLDEKIYNTGVSKL